MPDRTCTISGCNNRYQARGWCNKHYMRWLTTGSVELAPRPSLEDRFWSKVNKTDTCWLWTRCRDGHGYGQFVLRDQKKVLAHRFAYELVVGPIPEGLDIDHLCRVRLCCNPAHLEPVTRSENLYRGWAARKLGGDFHFIQ